MSDRVGVQVSEGDISTVTIQENVVDVELSAEGVRTLTIVTPGMQGRRGALIFSGEGAPADTLGLDGDWYLDVASRLLYGPKASSTWPTPGLDIGRVTARHVHVQAVAAASWTVNHDLRGRPYVLVFDDSDDLIITDLEFPSNSQVIISSPTAFTGSAYLT